MTQQEQPGLAIAAPQAHPELDQLVAVLEQLRAPGGCAWDSEQTHESLVRYLVEETYELIDAIESGNREEMIEELGDVLYQVIFHSDIAAHTPGEEFTLEDVAAHMTAKMVGRHPHVYGDQRTENSAATADDVNVRWDEMKKIEKPTRTSVLDGVPQGMPALALADKLLGKAEKLGMAPPVGAGIGDKPDDKATTGGGAGDGTASAGTADDERALGDQLLAIVAAARAKGLDSERALRASIRTLQNEMRTAETSASQSVD
jgi:XTP/dITP diphosphohydrolase